jgi:hypothetical protein
MARASTPISPTEVPKARRKLANKRQAHTPTPNGAGGKCASLFAKIQECTNQILD